MRAEAPLHGDVLDAVVSRVATLDLLPVSRVSRAWRAAAVSVLRRSPRLPPLLILHFQSTCGRQYRSAVSTVAYDPLSRAWRSLPDEPNAAANSHATSFSTYSQRSGVRFCALSHAQLTLATDPFGATWRELAPPRHWRTEPTVAVVGKHVVVVGGTSEMDEDASAVEVWSEATDGWQEGEPVPEAYRWTTAFSVATTDRRIYVLDPKQHVLSWFDPAAKRWGPVRRLSVPGPAVCISAIGLGDGHLILVGVSGSADGMVGAIRPDCVRLWAVNEDTLEVAEEEEVGNMPPEMVTGLVEDGTGGFWGMWSIGFLSEGGYGYLYNRSHPREFFLCEYGNGENGGQCRWERFPRPAAMEERPLDKLVFGCSAVAIDELRTVSALR